MSAKYVNIGNRPSGQVLTILPEITETLMSADGHAVRVVGVNEDHLTICVIPETLADTPAWTDHPERFVWRPIALFRWA